MATSPLLETFLTEIRAAVAGMAEPTYNHTLSAGQVTADQDEPGSVLPYVQVYVAGDIPTEAVTVKDKTVRATIYLDCTIAPQGTPRANRAAVLLLLHDLSIITHVSKKSLIFASPNPPTEMEQTVNYHGDAVIGGPAKLPFGRLALTLSYQRSSAGGL